MLSIPPRLKQAELIMGRLGRGGQIITLRSFSIRTVTTSRLSSEATDTRDQIEAASAKSQVLHSQPTHLPRCGPRLREPRRAGSGSVPCSERMAERSGPDASPRVPAESTVMAIRSESSIVQSHLTAHKRSFAWSQRMSTTPFDNSDSFYKSRRN
jgi:hypothetical protein